MPQLTPVDRFFEARICEEDFPEIPQVILMELANIENQLRACIVGKGIFQLLERGLLRRFFNQFKIKRTDAMKAIPAIPAIPGMMPNDIKKAMLRYAKLTSACLWPKDPRAIPKLASQIDELHGITRQRLDTIFNLIKTEHPVSRDLMEAPSSIYEEIKAYLSTKGIHDRISFENIMFGYSLGHRRTNWYDERGIGKLVHPILLMFVLGRSPKKGITAAEVNEMGNRLYGPLDKHELTDRMRAHFAANGITSREEFLRADYKQQIIAIIKTSPISDTATLFEAMDASMQGIRYLTYSQRKERLADFIY